MATTAPSTAPPASSTAQQNVMPLLPGIPAMGEPVDVPLSQLPPDRELHSDPPSVQFLDSVKNLGILQPIQLIRKGASGYTVAAGRRRIKAARATGMESVPALVFPEGWVRASVLAMAENEQRSANDLSDLQAIEAQRAEGFTDEQIRDAIGMSKQRFD
ncbi:MAG: ParB/RepB/Spo0J family partition protein, partial [Chloroflexales bacterium]